MVPRKKTIRQLLSTSNLKKKKTFHKSEAESKKPFVVVTKTPNHYRSTEIQQREGNFRSLVRYLLSLLQLLSFSKILFNFWESFQIEWRKGIDSRKRIRRRRRQLVMDLSAAFSLSPPPRSRGNQEKDQVLLCFLFSQIFLAVSSFFGRKDLSFKQKLINCFKPCLKFSSLLTVSSKSVFQRSRQGSLLGFISLS